MHIKLTEFIIPPTGLQHENISKYETSSPWKKEDVAFNVQNIAYPTLHTHEYFEILVILSGEIVHTINNKDYILHEGDCCFIRPDDSHRLTYPTEEPSQNNFLSINFMLTNNFYQKAISCYESDPLPSIQQDNAPISFRISNTIREKIQRTCLYIQTPLNHATAENVMICRALVAELLHIAILNYTTKNHTDCPLWLQELMIRMQKPENIAKKTTELIEDIPYSRSYIEKKFRKHFGISVLEFRNNSKMAYAKELLSSTSLSISQITDTLGFESISHFSRLFKNYYGTSPLQQRKQHNSPQRADKTD